MGRTLYLECSAGISGDMTVGALLDLGADEKVLMTALDSLPLTGYHVEIGRVKKSGVDCCSFSVQLDRAHDNHDHDMNYLHSSTGTYMQEHRSGQMQQEFMACGNHFEHEGEAHPHGHGHEGEAHPHGHVHEGEVHPHGHVHEGYPHGHVHDGEVHPHGHVHEGEAHPHGHVHEGEAHPHGHVHEGEAHPHGHVHEGEAHPHGHVHEGEAHPHGHVHEGEAHPHEHVHKGEAYPHGHVHEGEAHPHGHVHEGEHNSNEHTHDEKHGHHEHRGMKEITEIIKHGQMTEQARKLAFRIFDILAHAEAKAHGTMVDQVHFHEVGAVDSIVDIVAAAVCFDNLDITEVIVPKLCEGTGTVRCQHGILPIPVPAVANIISTYEIPLELIDVQGEFVTPTGAAIVAAVQTRDKLPRTVRVSRIGMGAGKRNYARPSILRAMLLKEEPKASDTIYKLESNIDDSTGEALGYVMGRLLDAGARDVHYHPVFMKKNRPGWQLNVICTEEDIPKLEQIIFEETTTIGIRRMEMERTVLKRETGVVNTQYGEVRVKICDIGSEKRYYPEYDSVTAICGQKGISYQEVYHETVRVSREL